MPGGCRDYQIKYLMIKIKIDNKIIEVEEGSLLHNAARKAGVEIPVMCWYEGTGHFTSCMVCVVKDKENGRLIPSCSVKVCEGMDIITNDPEIREFRKTALELLLSEHIGECEAPCKLSCPAGMDIPLMNRLLADGKFQEALEVVRKDIALPSVLGRICPAPCEGACRRKPIDGAVSICLLKRFAGDNNLNGEELYRASVSDKKPYRIAIAGAGPAGLSAAYYLQLRGYSCDVFEASSMPGGAVRTSISDEVLPKSVLDKEIKIIENTGVQFNLNHTIDKHGFKELLNIYDAFIIACRLEEDEIAEWGLEFSGTGIKADKKSYQTNIKKVFAVGSALRPSKLAIRSLGQGKEAAFSVEQFLNNENVIGEPVMFNSRFGRLFSEEYDEYLKESVVEDRISPAGGLSTGFTPEEVMNEAARCLRCDCRGKDDCLLRIYADSYGADQKRFASVHRKMIKKFDQHDIVIYESGKCIKCGRCVRITAMKKEKTGFTFIGRGFNAEIGVPFNEELRNALTTTAYEVVEACPVGALELKTGSNSQNLSHNSPVNPVSSALNPSSPIPDNEIQAQGKSGNSGGISFIFPILLFLISLFLTGNLFAQDKTSWPIFRGDPELRGISHANLPASPKLLWSYKADDGIKAPPVISKDIIITASVKGTVLALNLKGEPLWIFESPNSIEASALIYNNIVYIGDLDGTLFALDLNSGKELWKYSAEGQIMGSPNIHRSGSNISLIIGSYDYYLHCVDGQTGKLKWKYESDNFIHSTAAISDNKAIFGGCDGFLHIVEINTGKLKNKIDLATYIASSATTGNGYAYIGDYDGQFTGVSLNEDKIIWQFTNENSQLPFIASPSLYKNYIIAGGRDKHLYCLDKNNGKLIWKYNTGSRVDASPVIISDKAVVANMRGDLLIIDIQTGKPSWSYELGTPVSGNPAVIDNIIIVAADDGRIYCFGE